VSRTTWLLALDEAQLRSSSAELARIVADQDDARWQAFWRQRLPKAAMWAALDSATEIALPPPGATLVRLLRAAARGSALRQVELVESAWHVHYPQLSDDDAGFEVSESEEYEAVGLHLYATSAMPSGLEFLDETPDAATNWVSPEAVRALWRFEQREGMLATAGQHMSARGVPLGHDLLSIRDMLEFAVSRDAALQLWSGG
jgi:hypothetical protein